MFSKPEPEGLSRVVTAWFVSVVVLLGLAVMPEISGAQEERLEQSVSRETWRSTEATQLRRAQFMDIVKTMASPAFAGRAPGTQGGQLTTDFLEQQFEAAGLVPVNGQDSYLQTVRLTRYRTQATLSVTANGADSATLIPATQFVAWSSRPQAEMSLQGQPVFAGYGIQAPEFDWDDYQDLDVTGKIVLMLIGDPPSDDPAWFDGKSMSRHGRWDDKLALAASHGAAAVVLIHDAAAAGYPFSAVANTFGQQRINLSDQNAARKEPPLCIWISANGAEAMLNNTPNRLDALRLIARAGSQAARPAITARLQVNAKTQHEDFISFNVAGQLPGTPEPGADSAPVALVAHWDHLGAIFDKRTGKATGYFPGAADNAAGVAQMLDVARQLATREPRQRPVVFVSPTAEESGLLGARYYVRSFGTAPNPNKPVAALNIDVPNLFGRAQDVEVIALGMSSLDHTLSTVARDMQRRISPDYAPAIGRLYRSDQFEFIRHGIPAVWIRGGRKARTFSLSTPLRQIKQYLRDGYHQSGDTVRPWWQLDAVLEDANLIAEVMQRLANDNKRPEFNPGSPYAIKP